MMLKSLIKKDYNSWRESSTLSSFLVYSDIFHLSSADKQSKRLV